MRTCRIGFVGICWALMLGYVSSCTCPPPRGAEEPAPKDQDEPDKPVSGAEDLPAQVATFADEACACEDKACADAVTSAFNEWAANNADAVGTNTAGDEIAAQVARMGACADKFATPLPLHTESCAETGDCAEGLQCVRYRGIAGDKGPEFATCEIPCPDGGACPEGLECRNIADGPGQVCRK